MFKLKNFPAAEYILLAKSLINRAEYNNDDWVEKYSDAPDYSDLTHEERNKEAERLQGVYENKLEELVENLEDRDINIQQFEQFVHELTERYILLVFLVGSALTIPQIRREARNLIDEQIEIALESSRELGDRILAGQYRSWDGNPPQRSLSNLFAVWGGVLATAYQFGILFYKKAREMLRWDIGEAEHCATCLRLNKQIHPRWKWRIRLLHPKSRILDCGGWRCKCKFTPVPEDTPERGSY